MNVCLVFQDIVKSRLADEWCFLDGRWHHLLAYNFWMFPLQIHQNLFPVECFDFPELVKVFSHFLILSENELLMGIFSKYFEFLSL